MRVIISGGGTGGHIFPAIAIANEIRDRYPDADILFVGANNRMEMDKIPAAGYQIKGIPVMGIDRKSIFKALKSIKLFFDESVGMAKEILNDFKPDIVVGTGGFASAPVLAAADSLKIPFIIQEQNSYPGITNRFVGRNADKICVAYKGMGKYFSDRKIVMTGNPVRKEIEYSKAGREEALAYFGFSPEKKTLLVIGGSLGAAKINLATAMNIALFRKEGIQLIWQTGKAEIESYKGIVEALSFVPEIWMDAFIDRMDYAYAAADMVVSRAGAGTISELTLLGKPAALVPSPNVTADHQMKNAREIERLGGAVIIPEKRLNSEYRRITDMIKSDEIMSLMGKLSAMCALPNSAGRIVDEIERILLKSVYFIGIGGIGMSALARYYLSKGKKVAGYDRTPSPLTEALEKEGASVHYEDDMNLIPEDFRSRTGTLVIYTPAVPASHGELEWYRKNGFEVVKRSEALGKITRTSSALCVAGTHGKTTTASMIAHILKQSKKDCTAFLGGILKNYNSNLLLSDKSNITVVEADEYDRSFHRLTPDIAVITSVESDHLDIYGTEEAYREGFEHFTSLIRPDGRLLIKHGTPVNPRAGLGTLTLTYSESEGDCHAENIRMGEGKLVFDFVSPVARIKDIQLGVPVRINVENAVAAITVARMVGADEKEIKAAMASFKGSERRFDIQEIKPSGIIVIDDYAHHPSEVRASISSVKMLYPTKKITGIFQPHLYTRTRDFAEDFASALSLLDEVILLDIYPAREEPIPGITSQIIFDRITSASKELCPKERLLQRIESKSTGNYEVILMMGAGDIDRLVEPLRALLKTKK